VNRAEDQAELDAMRRSVSRGQPFGEAAWVAKTADAMGLTSSLRSVGRPRSAEEA
jgi:putative transposase